MDNTPPSVDDVFMLEHALDSTVRFTNRILQNLPADSLERLRLRPLRLPTVKKIEFPGEPIEHLFFLESGVASMTTTFEDGSQVEVGLFGFESILGISALMGTKRSLNRVYMQLPGHGYIAPVAAARAEFKRGGEFQTLALRNVQAQLCQTAQTAGCNARHEVQQRLARWLLLCADRSGTTSFAVSQEFLATMLGIRRMSANIAIGHFTELGLIDPHRGMINIVDLKGLEAKACECYWAVKRYIEDFTEFDRGFSE